MTPNLHNLATLSSKQWWAHLDYAAFYFCEWQRLCMQKCFSVCAACLDMSSPYLFKLVCFCLRMFSAQSSRGGTTLLNFSCWGWLWSLWKDRLLCVSRLLSLPGRKGESQKVGGPLHRSPSPSLFLTEGERWQLFCCCCWAPEPCSAPAMHRRTITIGSLNPSRKEWTWPWRSSTLILESSITFSSSGLSSSRTFR